MVYNIIKQEFENIIDLLGHNTDLLKNKSILITGANGLISSYLIDFLIYLNENHCSNIKIYALSRSIQKLQNRFGNADIHFIEQDLNLPFVFNYKVDYIIHAASNSHPVAFSLDPVGTMKTNLLGTINLLELAKECQAKFLYFSTGEIYGNNTDHYFREEDIGVVDTKLVRSCYPESKRAGETLCMAYKEQYNVPVNIARLCYIYGATITEDNSRADAQFLRNVLNKQDIVMKSEGLQRRTYCYVADAVCGILYILLKGIDGEVYNVSNLDSIVSVKEFAVTLANIAGVKVIFEIPDTVELKGYSKQADSILDCSKLRKIGWYPLYDISLGLEHTYRIGKEALSQCLPN